MNSTRSDARILLSDCRILLVEDDDGDAGLVTWALQRQKDFTYRIDRASTLEEGLEALSLWPYHVVLLDLNLPGCSDLETLQAVTAAAPKPAVVVITGLDDQATALRAVQAGAEDYLVKQDVNPHDISRAIRYALQRKESQNEMLRVREEFLSYVSHEFRTPLAVAIGATEMLQDGDFGELNPAAQRLVEMTASNLLALRAMVDDLIDTAMVRSGKLSIKTVQTTSSSVVAPAMEAMSQLADREGVRLHLENAEPMLIQADSQRITQVLINLISNAIKYTPAGGLVTMKIAAGPAGVVTFAVQDTGRGIPQESLPHIFDRLYQVPADETAISRRGLGLGLYISRKIVRAHDSELTVTSTLGQGSCFRFTLAGPGAGPGAGQVAASQP